MMNKQKGNMYPWVTHTWNPVKGKCPHDCSYCYMKRFPQKELRLDQKCFNDNLGKGNTIFVGSSCDMFAEKVPEQWLKLVFQHIRDYQNNNYLFQTRNPDRLSGYFIPPFIMCGTTIDSNRDFGVSKAPVPFDRFVGLHDLDVEHKMISMEPILDFDLDVMIEWVKEIKPDFVSIGADSKSNGLPEPSKDKVLELINEMKKVTNVKKKSNLNRLIA